jgi:hypothetical protein
VRTLLLVRRAIDVDDVKVLLRVREAEAGFANERSGLSAEAAMITAFVDGSRKKLYDE